jgi:hypothetical protein
MLRAVITAPRRVMRERSGNSFVRGGDYRERRVARVTPRTARASRAISAPR